MSNAIPLTPDQRAMFNQLGLERDPANVQDTKQLLTILTEYLHYPSDRLARIHREACRLGVYDEIERRRQMKAEFKTSGSSFSICQCCCCIQQEPLPYFTEVSDIETLNESIILFFSDIKYIAVWCLISFCVFGVFAIITNILSYDQYPERSIADCVQTRCILNLISLGSKLSFNQTKRASTFYDYEMWMRLALVLVWTVFFVLKLKSQRSMSMEQELRNVTAADFAVLIRNLPAHYDKHTLQDKLDEYANNVSHQLQGRFLQQGDKYDLKFTIVNFNEAEPYYEFAKALDQHKQSESKQFLSQRLNYLKEWICFRQNNKQFPIDQAERQSVYNEIDAKNLQMIEELRQLQQSAYESMKNIAISTQTRPVLVTFHHNYATKNMVHLNYLPWYSKVFKSCRQVPYTLNIPGIVVEPAPQPEDIVWENIGVPLRSRVLRSFLTYLATFLILFFSFFVLYVFSLFQLSSDEWYMSIVISLFVSIINQILILVIYRLSRYEKDETNTDFEISVAHKAIIAQLINSVVINILVNILTTRNFGKGGLAQDVFYLALTSGLLSPLTRALGTGDVWRYIKRKWYSFSRNKLDFTTQREYNLVWEKGSYEVGYNYVFVIKTTLFTAFFLSLQPIISLISCLGLIMMYYSEKYILFYRSRRPKERSILVNTEMNAIMRLSVVCFALGGLFFSHFIPESYQQAKPDLQDMVNLVIGLILYFIPLTIILERFQQIPQPVGLTYENQKIFLSTEYDRVNPLTRQEGIKNYGAFITDLKLKYHKSNKSFVEMISYVIDENKANPIETVCRMGASVKAHKQRNKQCSTISIMSEEAQNRNLELQEEIKSMQSSRSPSISLQQNAQIQAPESQEIKMSTVKDSSVVNNSFLNDLIKPKEIEKPQPPKPTFNIMDLIQNILEIPDEEEQQIKIEKYPSSPIKSQKAQPVDNYLIGLVSQHSSSPLMRRQSMGLTRRQSLPFLKKQGPTDTRKQSIPFMKKQNKSQSPN